MQICTNVACVLFVIVSFFDIASNGGQLSVILSVFLQIVGQQRLNERNDKEMFSENPLSLLAGAKNTKGIAALSARSKGTIVDR